METCRLLRRTLKIHSPPPYNLPDESTQMCEIEGRKVLQANHAEAELLKDSILRKLQAIESACPKLGLCYRCGIFHDRHELLSAKNWKQSQECQECTARKENLQVAIFFTLTWWDAHLIMRAHHLTPSHGISLDSLVREHSKAEDMFSSVPRWFQRSLARVVHDRLLVRVQSYWLLTEQNSSEAVKTAPACLHMKHKLLSVSQPLVQEFVSITLRQKQRSGLYRCTCCASDFAALVMIREPSYETSVQPKRGNCTHIAAAGKKQSQVKRRGRDELVVMQWMDLGTCASPDSKEWQSLTRDGPYSVFPCSTPEVKLPPYNLAGLPSIKARYETNGLNEDQMAWPYEDGIETLS